MNKLIVKLFGGTGNQLFQFFFALKFSKINKCKLFYDASDLGENDSWGRFLAIKMILNYYNVPNYIILNNSQNAITLHENQLVHPKFLLERTIKSSKKTYRIEGYYQNYRAINCLRKEIQKIFNKNFNKKKFQICDFKYSISIHTREYHNHKKNNKNERVKTSMFRYNDNLSWEFYKKCLDEILCKSKIKFILLFSDTHLGTNLKKKIKNFSKNKKIKIIDANKIKLNDLETVYLMSKSKFLIISNSTFSWWSAFISKSKVFCPVFSLWDKRLKSLDNWKQVIDSKNINPFTRFGESDYQYNEINITKRGKKSLIQSINKIIKKIIPKIFLKNILKKRQVLNYFKLKSNL